MVRVKSKKPNCSVVSSSSSSPYWKYWFSFRRKVICEIVTCSICEMNMIWCCFCFLRHYLKVSDNELWGYWRSVPSLQKKLQLQDVPSYAYAQEFKSRRGKTFSFHLKVFIHLLIYWRHSLVIYLIFCLDRMLLKLVKLKRLTSSSVCFLFICRL